MAIRNDIKEKTTDKTIPIPQRIRKTDKFGDDSIPKIIIGRLMPTIRLKQNEEAKPK
jgi:hypothetical protein